MRQLYSVPYGVACVYEIVNKVTGKRYVGSTARFTMRFREHKRLLLSGNHHSKHLQNAFAKYGKNAFVMRLLEVVSCASKMLEREQHWIDFFGRALLYNSSFVAGRAGQSLAPVYAIDPSTGNKKKYINTTEAAIAFHGRPCALGMINKACRTRKKSGGVYWTRKGSETIESIKEWMAKNKKKRGTPVFAFNIDGSLAKSFNSVAEASEELQVKGSQIRNALKAEVFRTAGGYTWSKTPIPKDRKSRKTKKVIQKKSGLIVRIWDSCREAAETLDGINHKGISSAATGYTKSHGGYQWEFDRI